MKSLEEKDFGDIESLQKVIITDKTINEEIKNIDQEDKIYHALTHPSVVAAFLKVYKEQ